MSDRLFTVVSNEPRPRAMQVIADANIGSQTAAVSLYRIAFKELGISTPDKCSDHEFSRWLLSRDTAMVFAEALSIKLRKAGGRHDA